MNIQANTLLDLMQHWSVERPNHPALLGKNPKGVWETITWGEYFQQIQEIAKGLYALGVRKGDCVAILSGNRPEWVLCQFAMNWLGAVPAPIYMTNTTEQTAYIVKHSQAKVAICDSQEQLDKYMEGCTKGLCEVEQFVTFDSLSSDKENVQTLAQVIEKGKDISSKESDSWKASIQGDDLCLLIYTSGTTGVPKAVELTHRNLLLVAKGVLKIWEPLINVNEPYRALSYLPLCHIAEQLVTNIATFHVGGTVYFCPDFSLLKEYLPEVKPTVFLGVPRVWEKFEAALKARFAEAKGLKAILLKWALNTETKAFQKQVETGVVTDSWQRRLAHKLVISKIREKLGLGELKLAVTGSAPISKHIQEFFSSLGIVIYEAYGMSETAGILTVTDYWKPKFGTVGQPLDCIQIKIAEDGEILAKGDSLTRGYLHMEAETKELYHEDWLQTGDLGEIDENGNLRITGRKKDLLITAGGKNVAPLEMEQLIEEIYGVGKSVVVGDRKPYLSALITLDPESIGELCKNLGLETQNIASLSKNPKLNEYLNQQIEEVCNSKIARYQTIKRFKVLPN